VQDQVFTTVLHSSLENLVSLGTGLILLVAAQSGFSGSDRTLNVGDFALFVYYLAFVTDFLWFLGGFLTLTKQTEVSFERMERLINRGEEGKQGKKAKTREMIEYAPLYLPDLRGRVRALPEIVQPAQEKALEELRGVNLTYHYPESDRGITDIDLTLQRGSLTVITGRVGSGKTTLLRLVLGLLPLQSGELFWNGQCIEHPDQFFVPPQSAYVPQVPQLFSNTLRENLVLGLHQSDQELQRAIAISALDQDLGTMPEGLNTLIGSKGMRLSGGQQQRTTVARLLVRKPELLVFDDLSSALDLETEQKLWTRLFALKHPTSLLHSSTHSSHYFYSPTFLIVSHRPSVLQQADHVIVLNNGTIEAQGKPDDVRQFLI
jgi:ATP-binding cassette, subfamily B, bacterial